MLGLLTLPKIIQDDLNNKKITMGHARVLSKLESSEQQKELEQKVISEGLSVRKLEEITQQPTIIKTNPQNHKSKEKSKYYYLQEELGEKLGTKVTIKNNKIEIKFANDSDLGRLLELMNIEVGK